MIVKECAEIVLLLAGEAWRTLGGALRGRLAHLKKMSSLFRCAVRLRRFGVTYRNIPCATGRGLQIAATSPMPASNASLQRNNNATMRSLMEGGKWEKHACSLKNCYAFILCYHLQALDMDGESALGALVAT